MELIKGYKKGKKEINPPIIQDLDNINSEQLKLLKYFFEEKIKIKKDINLDNIYHFTKKEQELIENIFTNEEILKLKNEKPWKKVIIWVSSILLMILIIQIIKKPISTVHSLISSLYWINIILFFLYITIGIKTSIWWNGFQKYIFIVFIFLLIAHAKLATYPHVELMKYNIYGNVEKFWHFTAPTSDHTWIRLKLTSKNTYEIWAVRPNAENWGISTKGNITNFQKQRYTDNGNIYYAVYLENFPFNGERSMLVFDDAFDDYIELVVSKNQTYTLLEGDDLNPWINK